MHNLKADCVILQETNQEGGNDMKTTTASFQHCRLLSLHLDFERNSQRLFCLFRDTEKEKAKGADLSSE